MTTAPRITLPGLEGLTPRERELIAARPPSAFEQDLTARKLARKRLIEDDLSRGRINDETAQKRILRALGRDKVDTLIVDGQVNTVRAAQIGVDDLTLRAIGLRAQDIQAGRTRAAEIKQREEDLGVVAPFLSEERELDIANAIETGVPDEVLIRLGVTQEQIDGVRQRMADLETIGPFLTDDERIDIFAALEGGIEPELLQRLGVTPEQIANATQRGQDLVAINPFLTEDQLDIANALAEGVPEETLIRLGIEQEQIDAVKQRQADLGVIAPFMTEDGLVNIDDAIAAGVDSAVLERLGLPTEVAAPQPITAAPRFTDRVPIEQQNWARAEFGAAQNAVLRSVAEGQDVENAIQLAQQRVNQYWQEFSFDVAGHLTLYEVTEKQLDRRIERAQERLEQTDLFRAGGNVDRAIELLLERNPDLAQFPRSDLEGIVRGNFEERQERVRFFQQQWADNRQTRNDFLDGVSRLRGELQETIQDAFEAIPNIVEGRPRPDIIADNPLPAPTFTPVEGLDFPQLSPEELRRIGLQVGLPQQEPPDVPISQQFPDGTRFQIQVDGRSVGFADGDDAIREALRQGFQVVPVTIVETETEIDAEPEGDIQPVGIPAAQQAILDRIEEQRERRAIGRFGRDAVLSRLEAQGLATADGAVFINRAIREGVSTADLRAVGFTEDDIRRATLENLEADVEFASEARFLAGDQVDAVRVANRAAAVEVRQAAARQRLLQVQNQHDTVLDGFITRNTPTTLPQFQSAIRRGDAIDTAIANAQLGNITFMEAEQLVADIPNNVTERDFAQARRALGIRLQAAGSIPVVGVPLSAAGTALTFAEDTPLERGINIGTDVISLIPTFGAAVVGSRLAAGAGGLARVGRVAKTVGDAEINSLILNPKKIFRSSIYDPTEAIVRPGRVIGLEETFTTLRVPAERGADLSQNIAVPRETLRVIQSNEFGGEIKDAVSKAAIETMQTGKTSTAPIAGSGSTVTIRAGAVHDVLGGAAFHATPDGRNFLAGLGAVQEGAEGGLFVAPSPLGRFAQATAFGGEIPLTDAAEAAVRTGRISSEPVPTIVMITDPAILGTLRGPLQEGAPKIYRHTAEIEALIPAGVNIPAPSQVRMLRASGGEQVALAVIGKPLTNAQLAKLKVAGLRSATRNIFAPGAVVRFEGPRGVRSSFKAAYLDNTVEGLQQRARELRAAGLDDVADQFDTAARRTAQRVDELRTIGISRLGAPGGVPSVGTRTMADRGRISRPESRVGVGIDRRVPMVDAERAEDRDDRPRGDEETSRIARTPGRPPGRATGPGLTPRVGQPGQPGRQPPERPPTTGRPPETPDIPRTGRPPDRPDVPRPPGTPVAPPGVPPVSPPRRPPGEPPRTPVLGPPVRPPGPPDTPRPPRIDVPTGPPPPPTGRPPRTPEGGERDDDTGRRTASPRVFGLNRGIFDTSVDLAMGETRTRKEIAGVKEIGTRQSVVPILFDVRPVRPQRIPWGIFDAIVSPDGTVEFERKQPRARNIRARGL